MQTRPTLVRQLLRLALPVALSQLSDMLTVIADTIMIGHVGTVPLAAATLANSIWVIGFLFALGFTIAITPLAGAAWGSGSAADTARWAKAGGAVAMFVGAAVTAILLALTPFLDVFGAEPAVTALAEPYFVWVALSTLPRIAFGVVKQTAEAMTNTRPAMIAALTANVANVGLNWVFIYGKLGMPEMGIEGAGLATFLSRVLMLVLVMAVYLRFDFFRPLRVALRALPGWPARQDLLVAFETGLPIAGQIILEVTAFALGAVMMGWFGAVPQAAHQVAMNLAGLTFMVALGLGSAATAMISNAAGRSDVASIRAIGKLAFILVLSYNCCTALCFFVMRFWLPTLYTQDAAVIELAALLMLYAGIFQIFDGSQTVFLAMLRGVRDVRIPTMFAVVSYAAVNIPLSYLLAFPFGFGPQGIWMGYVLGLVAASSLYYLRFRRVSATMSFEEPATTL